MKRTAWHGAAGAGSVRDWRRRATRRRAARGGIRAAVRGPPAERASSAACGSPPSTTATGPRAPGPQRGAAAGRADRPPRHARRPPAQHRRSSRCGRPPTRCGPRRTSPGRSSSPARRARTPAGTRWASPCARPTAAGWSCTPGSTRTASPSTTTRPAGPRPTPRGCHPDWVVAYGGKLYYNPGLPEVRRFVQDAMLDAVAALRRRRRALGRLLLPVSVAGQVFDDDAAFAEYGGGLPGPGRLAARQHRPAGPREPRPRSGRSSRGRGFGISPFGVWRNGATDPRGSDTRAGCRPTTTSTPTPAAGSARAGSTTSCPQVYWNIGFAVADYAKLVPWWADVVEGTGVRPLHRRGALQGGRPGAARALAGSRRAVPPSDVRPGLPAGPRQCLLLGKGSGRRPHRGHGPSGRRPLSDAGAPAALSLRSAFGPS